MASSSTDYFYVKEESPDPSVEPAITVKEEINASDPIISSTTTSTTSVIPKITSVFTISTSQKGKPNAGIQIQNIKQEPDDGGDLESISAVSVKEETVDGADGNIFEIMQAEADQNATLLRERSTTPPNFLTTYVKRVIVENNPPNNHLLKCKFCNAFLATLIDGRPTRWIEALDHVLLHSDLTTFRCRRCTALFKNRGTVIDHIRNEHGLLLAESQYIDSADDYRDEFINLIDRCFGPVRVKEEPSQSEDANYIINYCENVLAKNSVRQLIQCSVCHVILKLINGIEGVKAFEGVEHALSHSEIPGLQCRLCKAEYKTRGGFNAHMSRCTPGLVNYVRPDGGQPIGFNDRYRKEIIELIDRCFGTKLTDHGAFSTLDFGEPSTAGTPKRLEPLKLSLPPKYTAVLKLHRRIRETYVCAGCYFRTTHKTLMVKHSKMAHGK